MVVSEDEDPEATCETPNLPTGYLDDLFEDLEVPIFDSETLADKLNRVLENQKTLFSNQKIIFFLYVTANEQC